MLKNSLWSAAMCGVLLLGCSGNGAEKSAQKPDAAKQSETAAHADAGTPAHQPPTGTWVMYGGSQTGLRSAEDFEREMTILVLEDSTYTLTMMRPHIQLNFVEKGQVEYDTRNMMAKFSVFSATGVDFSGPEPRKLLDVDQVVPWQRDPGTVYLMRYGMRLEDGREYMQLSMDDVEDSYFVRMTPGGKGSTFDVNMVPEKGQ